jgi:tol-pal system protein YbgF
VTAVQQDGWTARVPVLLALPLAACAGMMPQEYTALQEDVRILRRDVAALSRSTEGSRAFAEERLGRVEAQLRGRFQAIEAEGRGKIDQLLASLKEEGQRLSQSQGDLSAKIGEFASENRITQGRLEETAHRINELNQRIDALEVGVRRLTELVTQKPAAAPAPAPPGQRGPQTGGPAAGAPPGAAPGLPAQPIPLPPPAAAPAPAAPGAPPAAALGATPDEVYKAALNDYTKGNYDLAINGFKTYMQLFPKTSLVSNAQYWLGESYYSQGKYPEAIREFEAVTKDHPGSNKVPSAMLKQGYAYLELRETSRGTAVLRELMKRFENSREARLAQERLRQVQ